MSETAENNYSTRNFVAGEIISVDKPLGWTSFDVVKRLRGTLLRRLHKKKFKVGHAGTLDPLASGVMIITTGRATKLIDSLQGGVKEYIAEIALGATTPSFDLETEIDATYPTNHITRELVEEVLARFIGRIEQIPPAYSACKIDGRRAYDMARAGETPELKAKILAIDEIELLDYSQQRILIRVVCSKGTYIRALARDIGAALGSGGHLTNLRRTRVGEIRIADCMSVDQVVDMIRNAPLAPDDQDSV
ncbi:MAG: tRNA pseudouridine(55) synthase TruB [Paramuribaculum sp.]|nr:tRNA pseudouridine(55) synthase TruB [Paramuribaculum sp.]